MAENYEICIICNTPLSNSAYIVTLRVKGAEGVNTAAHERGVDIVVTAGSCVRITCRQKFTDEKDISLSRQRNEESSCTRKRSYRISDGPYDNRTQCFFCGFGGLRHEKCTYIVVCSS